MESIVPTVALPPAIPLTDQVTPELAPVTVAVNCATAPAPIITDCGETATATTGGALIVTVEEADFVGSPLLVAATVAEAFCVTMGAVNLPVESIVPTVELPLATPLTDHTTPEVSPVTVAVNCTVCP